MLGMKTEAIEWGFSGVDMMGMGYHRLIEHKNSERKINRGRVFTGHTLTRSSLFNKKKPFGGLLSM